MVHLPVVVSHGSKGVQYYNGQRVSAETAGIVNQILDSQLPDVMKTLSPRRINGFNSNDAYVLPKLDHVKDGTCDQYRLSQVSELRDALTESTIPSTSTYKLKAPEYICFINHSSRDIASKPLGALPKWRHRKKKAPPSRVKSMDELLLEESLRRNSRTNIRVPDLRVKGSFAPGYQCKWEKFRHLPDIKPIQQGYERQSDSSISVSRYQDADANFSLDRVDEILKSEGIFTPDSGIGQTTLCDDRESAVSNIILDDDFFKGRLVSSQQFNQKRKGNQPPAMFSITASRIDPQGKPGKTAKSPTQSKESLAILQTRKRLPTLTNHNSAKDKPD